VTTYIHGKSAAFLHGAYRLSPWVQEVKTSQTIDTADTSHFESVAKTYIVGQHDGTISLSGLYDSHTVVGVANLNDIMSAVVASDVNTPVSFAPEGIGIGRAAVMALAKNTQYEIDNVISDVEKFSADIQVTYGIQVGAFISDNTGITGSGVDFTTQDNGASGSPTTLGARAMLHVPENTSTGNLTAVVQHSVDGVVWVDLITFAVVGTLVTTSESKTATGTINRYIRLHTTKTGTGSVTAVVSFARY
jgi:hypothetical protein